ncbi:transposase [Paraburkholderia madseniana]|uniref:transposase n=1 Tax=Paraburkholderia madseniana TaxID=2599607 RepID=UPI0015C54CCB|nr:transposase [Paraburkholderia madseniana]NPT64223.1 hypothetical protein [Paraburkholderia madseniana]
MRKSNTALISGRSNAGSLSITWGLFYLPPYSPELNLIEIVWKHAKYHWLDSVKQDVRPDKMIVAPHTGDASSPGPRKPLMLSSNSSSVVTNPNLKSVSQEHIRVGQIAPILAKLLRNLGCGRKAARTPRHDSAGDTVSLVQCFAALTSLSAR